MILLVKYKEWYAKTANWRKDVNNKPKDFIQHDTHEWALDMYISLRREYLWMTWMNEWICPNNNKAVVLVEWMKSDPAKIR